MDLIERAVLAVGRLDLDLLGSRLITSVKTAASSRRQLFRRQARPGHDRSSPAGVLSNRACTRTSRWRSGWRRSGCVAVLPGATWRISVCRSTRASAADDIGPVWLPPDAPAAPLHAERRFDRAPRRRPQLHQMGRSFASSSDGSTRPRSRWETGPEVDRQRTRPRVRPRFTAPSVRLATLGWGSVQVGSRRPDPILEQK